MLLLLSESVLFVHGALCVSYSGQCYAGQALAGRSANRGVCPQICRLPFDLQDADGHSLGKQHWLSLKDLDTHNLLHELIEAGVDSFKIEGRLKDIDYVKNITALYSQKLNEYIAKHPGDYCRSSDGTCRLIFAPTAAKSFNRMATDYFLNGRHPGIFNPVTPKSMGETIGCVRRNGNDWIEIDTDQPLGNGDGFCYVENGTLYGFRANRAEGKRLYAQPMPRIAVGTLLYRNEDAAFSRLLKGETATRKIGVEWTLNDLHLSLTDGCRTVSTEIETNGETAEKDPTSYLEALLRKLGDTVFEARVIQVKTKRFIPASVLADARRKLCQDLAFARTASLPAPACLPQKNTVVWNNPPQGYLANIHNAQAAAFFRRHGASATEPSFERQERSGQPVMYCRHCIKYELGACSKLPVSERKPLHEPLHLIYNNYYLRLQFDCARCQMLVIKE